MGDIPIPSHRSLWKAATRALVAALEAPGQTGRQRAASILGVDTSTVTRWLGEGYDHLMPGPVAMQLEFVLQRPVFTSVFGSLIGARVETDPPPEATPAARLLEGLFATLRQLGDLAGVEIEAARDGRYTPAERSAIRAEIFETIDALARRVRDLTSEAAR